MGIRQILRKAISFLQQSSRASDPKPSAAELRGEELFKRVFNSPARSATLKVNGIDLRARVHHINVTASKALGIDPALLRGGAEVYIVSRADFERYCKSLEADSENVTGIYAPTGAREILAVMQARKQILSFGARKVLVPDDANALTLCHEILHDLFNSWNWHDPHAERYGFCRLAVSQIYLTFVRAPNSPAAEFFKGVAARCAEPYDLDNLIRIPVPQVLAQGRGVAFTERTQAFIGEIFAYGGSMAIFSRMSAEHSEKDLGEVPEELRGYFERTVVHPGLL